jgi:hypothetical protein
MRKYLAIIDRRTVLQLLLCMLYAYICLRFDYRYNINITLLGMAVIFPLVFTLRESFKRRDRALRYLGQYKAALNALHFSIEEARKLDPATRSAMTARLCAISEKFIAVLRRPRRETRDMDEADEAVRLLFARLLQHEAELSSGRMLKMLRFIKDLQEGMENAFSVKLHRTPISLRAYCLVFVFVFPLIVTPTLLYHLQSAPHWIIYALGMLQGFVLISLFNVQDAMEDPFDQVGLDYIQLREFIFEPFDGRAREEALADHALQLLDATELLPELPAAVAAGGDDQARAALESRPGQTMAMVSAALASTSARLVAELDLHGERGLSRETVASLRGADGLDSTDRADRSAQEPAAEEGARGRRIDTAKGA